VSSSLPDRGPEDRRTESAMIASVNKSLCAYAQGQSQNESKTSNRHLQVALLKSRMAKLMFLQINIQSSTVDL